MNKTQTQFLTTLLCVVVLLGIYTSQNLATLILSYVLLCLIMLARTLFAAAIWRKRIAYIFRYISIMVFQIVFTTLLTFNQEPGSGMFAFYLAISTLLVLAPILVEASFNMRQYQAFFVPSPRDIKALAYTQFVHDKDMLKGLFSQASKARNAFSKKNLKHISRQMQEHDSFRYINNGSLTDEYFRLANESLADENVYIVLTDSGSPASEIISVFTQQRFNHASLSFDADLHTIISYNGGENVYPPGMNPEMLAWFCKKADSAVLIYRLPATPEQKEQMIEKVREINRDGSAYNLLGLVLKRSAKPNIMFCSQFVNQMLKYAGLDYLHKKSVDIRPSDFVELDYRRKLEFVREIRFS